MTQNEKALVWIPYRLAWGDPGATDLIPGRTDVIFYLDLRMIGNRWILSWNLERVIWIAHFKNKSNFFSKHNKFPKGLVKEILSFLNKNFDKQYCKLNKEKFKNIPFANRIVNDYKSNYQIYQFSKHYNMREIISYVCYIFSAVYVIRSFC